MEIDEKHYFYVMTAVPLGTLGGLQEVYTPSKVRYEAYRPSKVRYEL